MSRQKDQSKARDASDKGGQPAVESGDRAGALARGTRHRQLRVLLEHSPDAIVMVDEAGLVSEWNPAAEVLLGTPRSSAVGAPMRALFVPPYGEQFNAAWRQLLAGEAAPRFDVQFSPRGGPEQKRSVAVAPIRFDSALVGAVVIFRDPTAPAVVERATSEQPEFRPGTDAEPAPTIVELDGPAGLPGRWWLQRFLSDPPAPGMGRGVAVIDLDDFAAMTTAYGPDAADTVLTEFGELLKTLAPPGAFAHWRAETFVWILDTADPVADIDQCVARLTSALKEPFLVGRDRVWLTLSIGLATTTLVVGGDLLAAASDALQSAQRLGGSKTVYYEDSMESRASSGFRLANDLHDALTHDEFRLHYQPIMELATNEITGVEALVRWERPGVGLLAPGFFIDAAERTGQIVPLGNWVVHRACKNTPGLGSYLGGPRTMSINVSARQLRDPGLIDTLREAIAEGKCAPSTIILEVTESILLHDLRTVAASLEAIKALDVGLDLDDFGTGYSSLQYLRDLPIDRLKVDQSFVAGLGVNSADTAIVASTIVLAHALGLKVTAEGVETDEQLALLRDMGCDFAQGYLLHRPAEMETLTAWLDAYVPAAVLPPTSASTSGSARERRDAADRRDAKANRRDAKADTRDASADGRDASADGRDARADQREQVVNHREQVVDHREQVADLRDVAATKREHAEDD